VKPKGKRHNTIPVPLSGMFSAGDPSTLPEGFVSVLRNYMIRPNRFEGRAPFVYDALDAVSGFAIWQDMTNELQKTVATNGFDNKLYTKNANGIGYGTGLAGLTASIRLTGYTNILGKLYLAFDNGAGVPTAMAVYDGANLSMTPFNSTINARDIKAFIDRAFLIDPRVTVTNLLFAGGVDMAYGGGSFANNVTELKVTNGDGTISYSLTPTSTAAGGSFELIYSEAYQSTSDVLRVWRCEMRNRNAGINLPFTLAVAIGAGIGRTRAYPLGSMAVNTAPSGFQDGTMPLYKCTTAGTTAGVAPAFNTTVGSTTADGTVVWTCINTKTIVGVQEGTIPGDDQWHTFYVSARYPGNAGSTAANTGLSASFFIRFFNSSTASLTSAQLVPVEVGYRDTLADGNPKKNNHGQQITAGDFYYPFFNQESSGTATVNINAVIWSEISNPKQILARNTFPLTEIAGLATASIVSNGRLVVFKRTGMWIFKGNADPFEPILPESPALSVGCIGPLALDVSRDNDLYWIGENHVYKMKIGADSGPTMIDSPGMFEEIFARGSNWVESQPTYNAPLLAIDHANKDVWVYTQRGKIHVYSIQSGLWSYLDTNPTGTSAEVRAMIFDPTSNRMLVSFGDAATTRFDETSDVGDMIVTGGGTTWNIANDIVPKPFELFAARYEATLLEVGLFHLATVQNGSLSISYSYDRGATYTTPSGYPVTSWIGNPRIRLPVTATGESVTVKISRTGAGGRRNWTISKADALLRVHRGESPKVNAT